jgi:hypothetical protein
MHDQYPYNQHQQQYGQLPPNTEGFVAETVQRTATKRINHSRTADPDLFARRGLPSWVPVVVAIIGVALGAIALTFALSYRSTVTAQLTQMRQELNQAQSNLSKAQSNGAASFSSLNGKVSSIDNTLNTITQFNQVCSQALVGQNGSPGLYYYPCSAVRP